MVLSSKLFDIPGGFHLRVPIADYYSIKNGRLEGTGVTPDISVPADQALDVALGLSTPSVGTRSPQGMPNGAIH